MLGCGPEPRLYGQAGRAAVHSRTETIRRRIPMLTRASWRWEHNKPLLVSGEVKPVSMTSP